MNILPYVKHTLRPSNQTFIRLSALLGRFKHPVWVIGAGRSGTTWLCNLMCARHKYRFLFEPFKASHNPETGFLPAHYYLRPGASNTRLLKLSDKVFNGRTFFPDLDFANKHKLFDGLLVKDISANLFSYSLQKVKPEIDLILIIRNPFAVALSRQNKQDWEWFKQPEIFLNQKHLKVDYLEPFKDLILEISKTDNYILKQILIWSITHYVPINQFSSNQMQVVFYEDLVTYTSRELQRLENELRNKRPSSQTELADSTIYHPSRTTSLTSAELKSKSPVDWKNHIREKDLTYGNMILKQFDLDFLYRENGYPAISPKEVLNKV